MQLIQPKCPIDNALYSLTDAIEVHSGPLQTYLPSGRRELILFKSILPCCGKIDGLEKS